MTSTDPRPPGPRGLPFLGVGAKMAPATLLRFIEDNHAEHGDVFQVPLPGGQTMVVVCSPEGIERVLSGNRANYVKGKTYDIVRDLMGDSLVTLEGEQHTVRRRIAQPAFHKRSLVVLAETMVEATAAWFDRLQARLPEGGVIDVHREMTHITLEIVVECLFGRGFFERTNVDYDTLTQALELLSSNINGVPVPRWIPTPGNLKFNRVLKALNADVYSIIAAGRAAVERGEDDGSLLQMLLRSVDEETGEALSDEAVRDEAITLFIAGHETTALTMTWFFELATGAPGVVEGLRAEIEAELGDRRPTFGELLALTGVRRAVDEVLRMRPPAPWIARNVVQEDELGGYRVLPGDMITTSFWMAHRHPDHWEDPDRYDPERFTTERNRARHKYAFLPFSTGPRICIGKSFSYVEAAAIIVELVRRCDWTKVGPPAEPMAVATVRPAAPVEVRIDWR
jgi:cytochrome P450